MNIAVKGPGTNHIVFSMTFGHTVDDVAFYIFCSPEVIELVEPLTRLSLKTRSPYKERTWYSLCDIFLKRQSTRF